MNIPSFEKTFQTIRILISSLIILSSIFLLLFLAIEVQQTTKEEVDPTVRYYNMLARIYFATENWEQIHSIEASLSNRLHRVDQNLRVQIEAKLWENYLAAPSEYQGTVSSLVSDTLARRDEEFFNILVNRSNYENDATDEYSAPLVRLLTSIDADCTEATQILNEETADSTLLEILSDTVPSDSELLILRQSLELCSLLPINETHLRFGLTPRYGIIVYDSFDRVGDSSLLSLAEAIFLDTSEDPSLRLTAVQYMSNRQSSDRFLEIVDTTINEANVRGSFVTGPDANPDIDRLFGDELQTILLDHILNQISVLEKRTRDVLEFE